MERHREGVTGLKPGGNQPVRFPGDSPSPQAMSFPTQAVRSYAVGTASPGSRRAFFTPQPHRCAAGAGNQDVHRPDKSDESRVGFPQALGPVAGTVGGQDGGVGFDSTATVPGGGARDEEYDVKVLLTIYGDGELWSSLSKAEFDTLITEDAAFRTEVRESGELVGAADLQDAGSARTVKVRDGVPVVSDGSYLGSREYPTAFFVLDCDSLDRALALAAAYPTARRNGVEVRPLMAPNGTAE